MVHQKYILHVDLTYITRIILPVPAAIDRGVEVF